MSVAWDCRNLRTVSTHLRTEDADLLRRVCAERGTTPYHVMRRFLLDYIRAAGAAPVEKPVDDGGWWNPYA